MQKITEEGIPLWSKSEDGSLAEHWIEVGLTEGPRVSDADVKRLFEHCELPCERILWALDPITAWRAGRVVLAGRDPCPNGGDIDRAVVDALIAKYGAPPLPSGSVRYGQHDASWVGYYAAYRGAKSPDGVELDVSEIDIYEPIVRGACWFVHAVSTVILTPRVAPKLNARGNLHCEDGPAIWDLCLLDGVLLPRNLEWLVYQPERRTRVNFDAIENAEVRRVAIATFPDNYVQGEPTMRDSYGELYTIDEDLSLVRVLDASTDRVYWLRVPADTISPHAGVAWSFGMSAEEYSPEIQT